MSSLVFLQIVFNLAVVLGIYILWLRLRKPPQDDPRLSRGLQLLQSKIAVLEDLSDRTEVQVKQLTALMDQKIRQVQSKITEAQKHIHHVEKAIESSREIAELFQDKIPHAEMIERQNTIKYVRAACMAHEGKTTAEIAEQVDLPIGEIEFIAKVNKDQLMFDQKALPEWVLENELARSMPQESEQARDEKLLQDGAEDFEYRGEDLSSVFDASKQEYDSLKKLGDEFRQACRTYEDQQAESVEGSVDSSKLLGSAKKVIDRQVHRASSFLHNKSDEELVQPHVPAEISKDTGFDSSDFDRKIDLQSEPTEKNKGEVRRFSFPKIDVNDSLG